MLRLTWRSNPWIDCSTFTNRKLAQGDPDHRWHQDKSVQQLPLPDFTGKAVAQLITRCRASTPIWHIAASAATRNQCVAVALYMRIRFIQHFLI